MLDLKNKGALQQLVEEGLEESLTLDYKDSRALTRDGKGRVQGQDANNAWKAINNILKTIKLRSTSRSPGRTTRRPFRLACTLC